jgi:hypothetical protein
MYNGCAPVDTADATIDRVVKASRERLSLTWPIPVHDRLRLLVAIADLAGEATSESEIAAALIATATNVTGDELGSLLRRYRTMTEDELNGRRAENVVELTSRRRPGRPRRTA